MRRKGEGRQIKQLIAGGKSSIKSWFNKNSIKEKMNQMRPYTDGRKESK